MDAFPIFSGSTSHVVTGTVMNDRSDERIGPREKPRILFDALSKLSTSISASLLLFYERYEMLVSSSQFPQKAFYPI